MALDERILKATCAALERMLTTEYHADELDAVPFRIRFIDPAMRERIPVHTYRIPVVLPVPPQYISIAVQL